MAVARDLFNGGFEQVSICHGVVSLQSDDGDCPKGTRIMHAWVELEIAIDSTLKLSVAVDASNTTTQPVFATAAVHYYRLGVVKESAIRRYSLDEASRHCERLGHFGPFAKPLDHADDWTWVDEGRIDSGGAYVDDRDYTDEENAAFEILIGRILGK